MVLQLHRSIVTIVLLSNSLWYLQYMFPTEQVIFCHDFVLRITCHHASSNGSDCWWRLSVSCWKRTTKKFRTSREPLRLFHIGGVPVSARFLLRAASSSGWPKWAGSWAKNTNTFGKRDVLMTNSFHTYNSGWSMAREEEEEVTKNLWLLWLNKIARFQLLRWSNGYWYRMDGYRLY